MVRAKLDGINTTHKRLKDGSKRTYFYHRATGQRLTGKPGSAEFVQAYAAAEKLLQDRYAGTFTNLIREYLFSVKFEGLADSTKAEYRRMLTKIEARFGDMPLAALQDHRVRRDFTDWHEATARGHGPREADNRMSVLSAVLSWAVRKAIIPQNHATGFERLHSADRSEMIWLPEQIAALEIAAPEEVRRVMVVAYHTGLRQAAILRLCWSNIERDTQGQLWIKPPRTRKRTPIAIPCTEALQGELEAWERDSAVILKTKTGLPWKSRHFKSEWKKASDAAGIEDLHFHDLRGTAVTMLAEAGCSTAEIASISGHSQRSAQNILDRYLARTRDLAGNAIARLENARRTKFANQLQTGGAATEKGSAK